MKTPKEIADAIERSIGTAVPTLFFSDEELRKIVLALRTPATEAAVWIACNDKLPDHDLICLVSDGRDIALACYDARFPRGKDGIGWWNAQGYGGHDLELNFTPTHWKPLSVQLPQNDGGKS